MIRFFIMLGFFFMFLFIHLQGNLNKYINMKYAYLSTGAIVLFLLLSIAEYVRLHLIAREADKRNSENSDPHEHKPDYTQDPEIFRCHRHEHDHSHDDPSKLRRGISYGILCFPILTGLLLPIQTLDSSFVKAKGFSFPQLQYSIDNPGLHQFLRPDTSVFYGPEGYDQAKKKDLTAFVNRQEIVLTDNDYLKGMEVIYNYPGEFMDRTIAFDGFAYKGEQVEGNHYFVFRFGFLHCAADSGVYGMLVDFPKDTVLENDDWVHVSGKLTWELYQPFKQTVPVLKVTSWNAIDAPKNPYVYRTY